MENNTKNKIASFMRLPLWKVGACVTALDKDRNYCVDGHEIACTKVSNGYITVHGNSIDDARDIARKVISSLYNGVLNVAAYNTHKTEYKEHTGFEGLELSL